MKNDEEKREDSTEESQDDLDMGFVHVKSIKRIFCCLRKKEYQTGNDRDS